MQIFPMAAPAWAIGSADAAGSTAARSRKNSGDCPGAQKHQRPQGRPGQDIRKLPGHQAEQKGRPWQTAKAEKYLCVPLLQRAPVCRLGNAGSPGRVAPQQSGEQKDLRPLRDAEEPPNHPKKGKPFGKQPLGQGHRQAQKRQQAGNHRRQAQLHALAGPLQGSPAVQDHGKHSDHQ